MKWTPHNENMGILGLQGCGKSSLVKEILDAVPTTPRLIISPQNPIQIYGSYGEQIHNLDQIVGGKALLWTGKTDEHTINKIWLKCMTLTNVLVIVDDAHEFASKQKISNEWKTLINSGRNRGITSIFVSPAPNQLHNVLLQSCTHLFSFKFALESQIEYARKNFFGNVGWLLINPKLRPYEYQTYQAMQKHDFLYRTTNDTTMELHLQDGNIISIEAITDLEPDPTMEAERERKENMTAPELLNEIKTPEEQPDEEEEKEDD